MEFSTQCRTNADGTRAWILLPQEFVDFKNRLKKMPGTEVENTMRVTTYDGGQAQISTGSTATGARRGFIGLPVNVLPKIRRGSFNLIVGAASTEDVPAAVSNGSGVRTNVDFACSVLIPNGGGLVVDGGKTGEASTTNHWLVISAVAVDAKGNPIKLEK